jgi:shikimate kinase/3-dehydroquinate synthase
MRSLFLNGFMGTGKSTVGPIAAAQLAVPFVDTDETIAREAGSTIADLWRGEGEARFRERERALVERLIADATPHVVALGGGALLARDLRHAALDHAIVVTLTASTEEILRRVGDTSARPNLASANPARRVEELLDMRSGAYAECHAELGTEGVGADEVAEAACAVVQRQPLVLPLGKRTYPIDVVANSPEALTDAIARIAPSSLVVVTDATVRRARGDWLLQSLSHLALPRIDVTLHPGEDQKSIASVQAIWDAALGAQVDRDALVIGFGGGVTTDLAGFAAATLLRGVAFLPVPTTLLGMVDAAVGGKTGFDHAGGKNLVGAIHQPRAVVVDVAHLATLPARELRAGLAEVVKAALVANDALFAALEEAAPSLSRGELAGLLPIVREAVAIKARIVRADEHENDRRVLLNLGHTLGHALEAHGAFRRHLHGEAVAIGICAELDAFARHSLTPSGVVDRARALLGVLGLPTTMTPDERRGLQRFLSSDKKRRRTRIKLPIVTAVGAADVRELPPDLFGES